MENYNAREFKYESESESQKTYPVTVNRINKFESESKPEYDTSNVRIHKVNLSLNGS